MQAPTGIFDHDIITSLILKVMKATKNMTAPEIRQAIVKEGVDGVMANKVLDGMIRTRSFFDRSNGRGNGVTYCLKKHVAKAYDVSLSEAVENMLANADETTSKSIKRIATTFETGEPIQFETTEGKAGADAIANSLPILDLEKDSIDVAIWKVMSDGQQYTVQDLEILLSDAKMFSVKSVSPRMSIMRKAKMVVRAIERSGRTIKYELIPGYPMPENVGIGPQEKQTRNYKNKASPLAADPTLPPNTLAPKISDVAIPKETLQIKKEEDMNAPAKKIVKVPVTLPQGDSPLKVMITICGIEYSMADLKAIVGTFDSHFDVLNPKHDVPNALVAVEYKVGDMTFSLSGARRLVADYKKIFE